MSIVCAQLCLKFVNDSHSQHLEETTASSRLNSIYKFNFYNLYIIMTCLRINIYHLFGMKSYKEIKMQKKLLLFATTILLSQASMATNAPFTGLYGSMSFGWMNENVDINQKSKFSVLLPTAGFIASDPNSINTIFTTSPTIRANSETGGVAIGFASAFKNVFIFGLEARANIESLNAEYENHGHPIETVPLSTRLNADSSIKLKNDYSLLFKLGYVLQPNTLIYGLIGPSWGYFNLYSTTNATSNVIIGVAPGPEPLPIFGEISGSVPATDDGYQTGWLAGIGLEYLFWKNASIGLEYTHADYGDLDFPDKTMGVLNVFGSKAHPYPTSSLSNQAEFNAETNNILLKLNYYIG